MRLLAKIVRVRRLDPPEWTMGQSKVKFFRQHCSTVAMPVPTRQKKKTERILHAAVVVNFALKTTPTHTGQDASPIM